MTDLAHPHDHLLKALLADAETAGTLLRERLPAEVIALLAPDPPELVDGTFIDDELREHLTDRLFRSRLAGGGEAFIYTLLEHKSWPDRKTGWQLHRYMTRILEQWEREHPDWEQLPPIIGVVIYHGATPWKISDELQALMSGSDALRPYLPNFRFVVVDLGQIDNDDLSNNPRLRAGLLALKFVFRKGEQKGIMRMIGLSLRDAPNLLYQIALYMVTTYDSIDEAAIRELVRTARPKEEAMMVSQFAKEILSKNPPVWVVDMVRQEGRQEGEATLLLRQLRRRFGQLPNWVSDKVNTADMELLEILSDRILDARSLEEVFSD
jgi:predicted transposase YdaD